VAIVKSAHPDHDGVVRDAIVRYALLKPGPEPYIAGFNKKGPFKTKLVAVQNLDMMYSRDEQKADKEKFCNIKPGGSTEVDWGASKDHMVTFEKHEQENNGTHANSVLMHTQGRIEERPAAAYHFTGLHDGIGAAPHSTRNCGP
jgi:hypothetical protein